MITWPFKGSFGSFRPALGVSFISMSETQALDCFFVTTIQELSIEVRGYCSPQAHLNQKLSCDRRHHDRNFLSVIHSPTLKNVMVWTARIHQARVVFLKGVRSSGSARPSVSLKHTECEPLLMPSQRRFVLFPIQYHEVSRFLFMVVELIDGV